MAAAALPVIVALYVFLITGAEGALRYPNLALVQQAAQGPGWRRHVPPALMLAAFTHAAAGHGRAPSAEVSLPSRVASP